eukprot:Rmarinus@m.14491
MSNYLDELGQRVIRAFYDDGYVVVFDALVKKRVASDETISQMLKMTQRECRSYLNTLRERKFVPSLGTFYEKLVDCIDTKDGRKQFQFWFIDYRYFVDSCRYHLFQMVGEMDEAIRTSSIVDAGLQYACYEGCCTWSGGVQAITLMMQRQGSLQCPLCGSSRIMEKRKQQSDAEELKRAFETDLARIHELLRITGGFIMEDYNVNARKFLAKGETGEDDENVVKMETSGILPDDKLALDVNLPGNSGPLVPETQLAYYSKVNFAGKRNPEERSNEPDQFLWKKSAASSMSSEVIRVGSRCVKLSEVTQQDMDEMTGEEYTSYCDRVQSLLSVCPEDYL